MVVVVDTPPACIGLVVAVVEEGPKPNDDVGPVLDEDVPKPKPVVDAIEPNEEEAKVDEFAPKTAVFPPDSFPTDIVSLGFAAKPPLVGIDDANAANEKGVDAPFVFAVNPKGLGVDAKAPLVDADDATEPKENGFD
jgi:hypothetical protein